MRVSSEHLSVVTVGGGLGGPGPQQSRRTRGQRPPLSCLGSRSFVSPNWKLPTLHTLAPREPRDKHRFKMGFRTISTAYIKVPGLLNPHAAHQTELQTIVGLDGWVSTSVTLDISSSLSHDEISNPKVASGGASKGPLGSHLWTHPPLFFQPRRCLWSFLGG